VRYQTAPQPVTRWAGCLSLSQAARSTLITTRTPSQHACPGRAGGRLDPRSILAAA